VPGQEGRNFLAISKEEGVVQLPRYEKVEQGMESCALLVKGAELGKERHQT